ncbi:hypothetical protein B0H14DRAFT_3169066 [Mycena olivaceomarginata]|nr:hypothetical protein B0H14DRAFT_3169066 [Mycena olivaceomarginata]
MPDINSKQSKEGIGKLPTGYKELADQLTSAVEALKQQPPSTDKKTAFWDSYKTLADEFDKEFQRKYGNDLDTSLIFAGLFSAVSSAFIILIQPEFRPDPNATTQALLGLLVQNITGAAIPVDLIPQSRVPLQIVVVAQALLYFSLLSTLLAALLAVQGKECLLYYDSVGKRGTIAERGLERQRKFDGLRRWKFDLAMQVFPLLLQLALLLFALALSIYLWTIHHIIAGIVLVLTGLGSIGYAMMTITSLTWEDSPFQTSLGFLLKTLLKTTSVANSPPKPLSEFHHKDFPSLSQEVRLACNRALAKIKPLLPLFNSPKHQDSAVPIFGPPPPPSEEISAVIWVLETSTNPVIVASCCRNDPAIGLVASNT